MNTSKPLEYAGYQNRITNFGVHDRSSLLSNSQKEALGLGLGFAPAPTPLSQKIFQSSINTWNVVSGERGLPGELCRKRSHLNFVSSCSSLCLLRAMNRSWKLAPSGSSESLLPFFSLPSGVSCEARTTDLADPLRSPVLIIVEATCREGLSAKARSWSFGRMRCLGHPYLSAPC